MFLLLAVFFHFYPELLIVYDFLCQLFIGFLMELLKQMMT